jgi:hypothetical protein
VALALVIYALLQAVPRLWGSAMRCRVPQTCHNRFKTNAFRAIAPACEPSCPSPGKTTPAQSFRCPPNLLTQPGTQYPQPTPVTRGKNEPIVTGPRFFKCKPDEHDTPDGSTGFNVCRH